MWRGWQHAFGSALQATPHFHSLVPDGVFAPVPPMRLGIAARVTALLRQHSVNVEELAALGEKIGCDIDLDAI